MTSPAQQAHTLDQNNPFLSQHAAFDLPSDVIYLNGNSLGPLTHAARECITTATNSQWREELVRGWNTADWVNLPTRCGEKIARLIGAPTGQVICADSTSINLFKLLSAFVRKQKGRSVIVSDRNNFPTDLYIAQGLIEQLGSKHQLILADSPEEIPALLNQQVAVLMLSHVNYLDGYLYDMPEITKLAQDQGILTLWDLAHSAGALDVAVETSNIDGAVGCGYKFLNGGPGAPAFLYLHNRLVDELDNPLSGWFGHRTPFSFCPEYNPSAGIERFLCGTPAVISMSGLDAALDVYDGIDTKQLRQRAMVMGDFFLANSESMRQQYGLECITPLEHTHRGSQLSFRLDKAYQFVQALAGHGVITDFREPDVVRLAITPLFTDCSELLRVVEVMADILGNNIHHQDPYQLRKKVT